MLIKCESGAYCFRKGNTNYVELVRKVIVLLCEHHPSCIRHTPSMTQKSEQVKDRTMLATSSGDADR